MTSVEIPQFSTNFRFLWIVSFVALAVVVGIIHLTVGDHKKNSMLNSEINFVLHASNLLACHLVVSVAYAFAAIWELFGQIYKFDRLTGFDMPEPAFWVISSIVLLIATIAYGVLAYKERKMARQRA